jgi:hypothetical protein
MQFLNQTSAKIVATCLMPLPAFAGAWAKATSRMSLSSRTRLKLLGINLRLQKLFLHDALTLILRLARKSSRGNARRRAKFIEKVFVVIGEENRRCALP